MDKVIPVSYTHLKVVVIEDLISTGGSSLKAVEAIRRDGCEVIGMVDVYKRQVLKCALIKLSSMSSMASLSF